MPISITRSIALIFDLSNEGRYEINLEMKYWYLQQNGKSYKCQ